MRQIAIEGDSGTQVVDISDHVKVHGFNATLEGLLARVRLPSGGLTIVPLEEVTLNFPTPEEYLDARDEEEEQEEERL